MPEYISFGEINTNSEQQNAGVFIGDISLPGADTSGKNNFGRGAIYGFGNIQLNLLNVIVDAYELVDGVMLDTDQKSTAARNR